jgi:hypothetical protein
MAETPNLNIAVIETDRWPRRRFFATDLGMKSRSSMMNLAECLYRAVFTSALLHVAKVIDESACKSVNFDTAIRD